MTVLDSRPARPAADRIRLVVDSRPPALSWVPTDLSPMPPSPAQPSLLDLDEPSGTPHVRGVRRWLVDGPGSVSPPPGLPDPAEWSATVAVAVAEALSSLRPVSQLERWLDDRSLADLRCAVRLRRRTQDGGSARRSAVVGVVSVRAQCPSPTAVEATAHLRVGPRSMALALRFETWEQRWLVTALQLAVPRVGPADNPPVSVPQIARGTS